MYLSIKTFHIIAMVVWFSGLLYLPKIFTYHANTENKSSFHIFKIMERQLFTVMSLGAMFTIVLGSWLFLLNPEGLVSASSFQAKLVMVVLLLVYHYVCYSVMRRFRKDNNHHSNVWYQWFSRIPSVLLAGLIILIVI